MKIAKQGPRVERNYVKVPNAIARGGLSLQAVGLYTYLASLPDDATVRFDDERPWSNGRDATRAAMAELRERGIVETKAGRDDGRWSHVLIVRLSPAVDNPVDNPVDNSVDNHAPTTGFPSLAIRRI